MSLMLKDHPFELPILYDYNKIDDHLNLGR
jgi:hypothetical protein